MYYVYILRSLKDGSYYVGFTEDVKKRVERHNKGFTRYTKNRGPWELIYTEQYATRAAGMRREKEIKGWKSRQCIEELIK